MAEPIANDWRAINHRLQQIKAEQAGSYGPCPECGGRGWVAHFVDGYQSRLAGYKPCSLCDNPRGIAAPRISPGR
jgi:hypothetical protein